jgi:hypothetical protein
MTKWVDMAIWRKYKLEIVEEYGRNFFVVKKKITRKKNYFVEIIYFAFGILKVEVMHREGLL